MPPLQLRFKKVLDGDVAFTLVRPDGFHSTDRIGHARSFGPVHDLTHYVVERALAYNEGFLGLVASGWSVRDFEVKGTAKRLPAQAVAAEAVAGAVSFEAMVGTRNESAAELSARVGAMVASAGHAGFALALTDPQLDVMYAELAELRGRWNTLAPGETLVLEFGAAAAATVSPPSGR